MAGDLQADDERLTTVGLLIESAASLRQVFERRLISDGALSAQAFDVLIRLARTPQSRLRMSDLADQTSLTPSGLTRSVDRLERSGLVSRQACADDRRGAFAVLTARGRTIMDEAIPNHITHLNEILNGIFTPEEEEQLSSLLRTLRDHLYDPERRHGSDPGASND
jgi:MarR family transcriptional regulator, 2-MHQ and catechol-resistance regulon repressor